MRKVFLMLITALFSLEVKATCSPTPECSSLGYKYSMEECGGAAIKCPSGNDYYCPTPICKVGDLYYSDNTCLPVDKHDSSKTLLGVVVHTMKRGKHGQIMAPWPIDKDGNKSSINVAMTWGKYNVDVIDLLNHTNISATQDYDSCDNTDKIVAAGDALSYPAAWATRKYAPTTETAGKWCLPAAGIMVNIYNNQTAIQNAISKVNGVNMGGSGWSSSEADSGFAWVYSREKGLLTGTKFNQFSVHPVLEF